MLIAFVFYQNMYFLFLDLYENNITILFQIYLYNRFKLYIILYFKIFFK